MIQSMIFFPQKEWINSPDDFGLPYQNLKLQTQDHVYLHAWFLPARHPQGVMLFLHGNAGNISGRLLKAQGWIQRGYSVLLLDYRGYGQSSGSIQQGDDLVVDSRAALDWIKKQFPESPIVLYGESIGSYPAIRLAVMEKLKGLILEAPFTSFKEIGALHYPWIPQAMRTLLLTQFSLSNDEWISQIQCPLFILHGTQDEICPFSMSEKLIQRVSQEKELFEIPDGKHNDLPITAGDDFWDAPAGFLARA